MRLDPAQYPRLAWIPVSLNRRRIMHSGQQQVNSKAVLFGVRARICFIETLEAPERRLREQSVRQGAQYRSVSICRLLILGPLIPRDLGVVTARAVFGFVLLGIIVANLPIDACIIMC